MNPTLQEIGALMKQSDASSDKHFYGQIQKVNTDDTGKVTSYEVSLGGSSDTMTCRKLAGAKLGDTVMVTLMANGVAVVTGTLGGDADAADAKETADEANAAASAASSAASAASAAASGASALASQASQTASEAKDVATSMNNHFWYDENGAHVSKADQSTATGAAVTMGASGIVQTMDGKMMSSQTASGTVYYQSDGTTRMAEYGKDGAGIYADGYLGMEIVAGGMTVYGNNGSARTELAHIGYGNGKDESGSSAKAPYYTFGIRTGDIGNYSVAEGAGLTMADGTSVYPQAAAFASHAEGASRVTATAKFAHAEGANCEATSEYAHAEGGDTTAAGAGAHAEGGQTTASAIGAHAEGGSTTASGSYAHSEGNGTTATALYAHAEGYLTTASGWASHAEGQSTEATAPRTHAEGTGSKANQTAAHAEGVFTVASGYASHAGGEYTKASSRDQTAIGKYNVEDTSEKYALIVGNGKASQASNALALDWDGGLTLANHSSPVGTVLTASLASDKSVKSATSTALCSITLPPGVWMVVCGVRFPANSSGYRRANLSATSGSTDQNIQVAPAPSGVTQINFTRICQPETSTTYYLNAMHSAGSALTMPAGGSQSANYINAVRIV